VAAGGGPVLGGLLVEFSWRWIFLINVPIVVVTVLAGMVILPRDTARASLRIDGVGLLLVLGAIGLVCAALVQAAAWPAFVIWPMLGAGITLAVLCVFHATRHPDPVIPPRLFAAPRFRISALGLLAYYVGFSVMLLGTTLLMTGALHLSVLEAALGIAPGPISAGITSPFSGRLTRRLGVRRMLLFGAGLFGLGAAWPLAVAATGATTPSYVLWILPSLLLWGVANAFIQPTLFAGADAAPRDDLSLATAVLATSRQLGAALGVAMLVGLLTVVGSGVTGFQFAWALVLISAVLTAVAGLFAAPRPLLANS
jgi:MFS family permease